MRLSNSVMVTGGAGFIGSALVRTLIRDTEADVINVDRLTYAGNLDSLGSALDHPRHHFHHADICDGAAMAGLLETHRPRAIFHLAAESHVDRSIDGPAEFIRTNLLGTFTLLEAARRYWSVLREDEKAVFRFVHVSTDEVYGSLDDGGFFTEESAYRPSSPYSASKAGSDHLARAWWRTYGLPTIITSCSNNYGPYQFPEKLIPLMVLNARDARDLPVYGHGENVRDWLYVDDHVAALRLVLAKGKPGDSYAIGGGEPRSNLEVVRTLCAVMDERLPGAAPHERLIRFVADRPGHDLRYAIDSSKATRELGWRPAESFASGLRRTIDWYLANPDWCERVQSGAYRRERLGLGARA